MIPSERSALSRRSLLQPSGKLSLKTPGNPSNRDEWKEKVLVSGGSLYGEICNPEEIKVGSYSKYIALPDLAKRPTCRAGVLPKSRLTLRASIEVFKVSRSRLSWFKGLNAFFGFLLFQNRINAHFRGGAFK